MGQGCSCAEIAVEDNYRGKRDEQYPHAYAVTPCPDPVMYDLVRRNNPQTRGQHYLLYKKGRAPMDIIFSETDEMKKKTTKLVIRKSKPDLNSTQVYAIRSNDEQKLSLAEQRPEQRRVSSHTASSSTPHPSHASIIEKKKRNVYVEAEDYEDDTDLTVDPYLPRNMLPKPKKPVTEWACVSEEYDIYVCDTGLTHSECDALVQTTEHVCKGHYAAYTYAKQTLGCREFPALAHACRDPVHRVAHCIWRNFPKSRKLQLDDREPHIVKYDISKKERQKLDMHTDKSEWTFLIALSDGCGLDYHGGGTYFEAIDATVHVQRGHALIFPGKLRHCGQRITQGLRFLLVGFLVDKQMMQKDKQKGGSNKVTVSDNTDESLDA
mmetsp:Transcript_4432/g.6392  ORF Transcript_4432/g.6392 Transcript_4432/m.6392 type:complete len:379 (-) Transcript_4432:190-1326(-)|eukprot:CAMPEP_0194223448 /NCGR_PEP_ID=MMETSP0156-20130528/35182_1 /TAXON_ID=33649 /ORGANISM="Thalassionema nitzschioides, Strain L26-B" /LENGTH=378 /DNA_ID=CAMNT_0038954615 /DNA_START=628 /DNA_END=1764 /DNA_ORIENTATION=-